MSEDGTVCVLFSEFGDLILMEELNNKSGLVFEKIIEEQRPIKVFLIIVIQKPALP